MFVNIKAFRNYLKTNKKHLYKGKILIVGHQLTIYLSWVSINLLRTLCSFKLFPGGNSDVYFVGFSFVIAKPDGSWRQRRNVWLFSFLFYLNAWKKPNLKWFRKCGKQATPVIYVHIFKSWNFVMNFIHWFSAKSSVQMFQHYRWCMFNIYHALAIACQWYQIEIFLVKLVFQSVCCSSHQSNALRLFSSLLRC